MDPTQADVQIKVYVSGYLTAWGLAREGDMRIDLQTDRAHDPYGMFDDVTVYIDRERKHWNLPMPR